MPASNHCGPEFNALVDCIDHGVLLFNTSASLRAVNSRFADLAGLDFSTVQQCDGLECLIELLQPRLRDADTAIVRWRGLHANRGEAAWDDLHLIEPPRVLERFSRPIFATSGQPGGWLELYRDVTAERAAHPRILQADKMAALGQLVSGIAHELNNPLTSIMGYSQLLLAHRKSASSEVRGTRSEAQKIFDEAERARRIVRNLLIFAREAKPERVAVDLNELVERTLALRSYEFRVENIAVTLELAADLPMTMGDPQQLQQVILNLIVNAEHALQRRQGLRSLSISTLIRMPKRLVLEVADNGPGIKPEILGRIFEPFFTTKPAGVGTGLGLSIAYGIVKEHGGEITVERRRQPGACFVVELPIVEPPAKAAPPPVAAPQWQPARHERVASRHILVVEDEPTVAQLIRDVMTDEDHQVEILNDSQHALQRVLHADPPFDLIICDLKMPRLDGQGLHRALAAKQHPSHERILFITGDTLSRGTMDFLEHSGARYLAKPFLVEELKQAVERCWAEARADSPAIWKGHEVAKPHVVRRSRETHSRQHK